MAEDEDREVAAAPAKLAEQDAAVAEDARAALEWVAGEPVRAFITQERIRVFVQQSADRFGTTPSRRGKRSCSPANCSWPCS